MTSTQWGEVLVSYSLQVLVVMSAGKLLESWVAKARDQCALWSMCFSSTLLLGCAGLFLPRLHLIQPWSRLQPHVLLTIGEAQVVVGRLLLATWCIGASVSMIRWMAREFALQRALRRCERLPAEAARLMFSSAGMKLTDQQLPRVLISDEFESPFCRQLHRPLIVLPRFLLQSGCDDLRHVLIHELEHLKTNHPLQLFVQHLAHVLCWFHPAVWGAAGRASLAREFACDDAAAAEGVHCAAYLRTLLRIAERCETSRHVKAIGFSRSPHEIILRAHRLVRVANDSLGRRKTLGRYTAIGIVFLATCLASQAWLPFDPLSSSRSVWSPWPGWTAKSLHSFGICLRDYEPFDRRVQLHEILHEDYSHIHRRGRTQLGDVAAN